MVICIYSQSLIIMSRSVPDTVRPGAALIGRQRTSGLFVLRRCVMVTFFVKERACRRKINSSMEAYESIKKLGDADQESFWVLGFNRARNEIFRKCLFLGGASSVGIHLDIVFKRLLKVGAQSWIAIHNHPSGEAKPSKEDREFVESMAFASKMLGIELSDNIIITKGGYFSFADERILPNIIFPPDWCLKFKKNSNSKKSGYKKSGKETFIKPAVSKEVDIKIKILIKNIIDGLLGLTVSGKRDLVDDEILFLKHIKSDVKRICSGELREFKKKSKTKKTKKKRI